MTRSIDPVETGAQTRHEEQEVNGLVESPHLDQTRTVSQIENAGELILEAVETGDGHEVGAYWKTALAARDELRELPGPDEDVYAGKMLATEERIRGEHWERERQREKAVAAHEAGITRAARARSAGLPHETVYEATTTGGRWHDDTRVDPEQARDIRPGDPRERLAQAQLAAVNQAAADLDETLGDEVAMGRAEFSRCIARRVVDGDASSVMDAAVTVRRTLERLATVRQDIVDVNQYDQWETTVEVEVVQLFQPADASQAQVGHVTDGTCEPVTLTVWERAGRKPTLHEGDRVRLECVKVNAYEGDLTLAVTSDTAIIHLEHGTRIWESASDFHDEQRHRPCSGPGAGSEAVARPEAARFEGTVSWVFPASACPDWWTRSEDVQIAGDETAVQRAGRADGIATASADD